MADLAEKVNFGMASKMKEALTTYKRLYLRLGEAFK